MKALILILVMGFSGEASAGVGGISGGHVHFQKFSTWVSPVYSKTLCVAGDHYRAELNVCEKTSGGDSDSCQQFRKIRATQPLHSTREICVEERGDGNCVKWATVPYFQDPVRTVSITQGDREVGQKTVVVPGCR